MFAEPDKAKFLFDLLSTHHAESGLNTIFSGSKTKISINRARSYVKEHMAPEADTRWVDTCYNTNVLFILAALLAWCNGESPKHLYRQFGIHYALLSKLAEQIGYLVEISRELMRHQLELTYEECEKAVLKARDRMKDLFISIYFGVNTEIIKEIYSFLKEKHGDDLPEKIERELSLNNLDPTVARGLRKIVIRYKFFEHPPEVDMTNVEMRNNFLDMYRRYTGDVKSFDPHILDFFRHKFPSHFEK